MRIFVLYVRIYSRSERGILDGYPKVCIAPSSDIYSIISEQKIKMFVYTGRMFAGMLVEKGL